MLEGKAVEIVNELVELKSGNLQWTLDPRTYAQVSGMYAIGLAAIVLGGAAIGAYGTRYILNRMNNKNES